MISGPRLREIALALPDASEAPHFDRTAFRTPRRIFCTLPADGLTANLMLEPDVQMAVCEAFPTAFSPVPGGWGRMGATTVDLGVVSEANLKAALLEAHARASEPPPKRARKARR